jgi:hypothetical protein
MSIWSTKSTLNKTSCISLKVLEGYLREVLAASRYLENMAKRAALENFDEYQMDSVPQRVRSGLAEGSVCY